jgi:alpha-L-fucosidase
MAKQFMYKVFSEGESVRFTQSKDGKTLNIFLFNFPEGAVHLKNVSFNAKTTVKLIGSNKKLKWKTVSNGIDISIPASLKNITDHVWVLQVQL